MAESAYGASSSKIDVSPQTLVGQRSGEGSFCATRLHQSSPFSYSLYRKNLSIIDKSSSWQQLNWICVKLLTRRISLKLVLSVRDRRVTGLSDPGGCVSLITPISRADPRDPPELSALETLLYDEPGRCCGLDSHSHHFRVVSGPGGIGLLARPGLD